MALIAHKGAVGLLLQIIESRNGKMSGAIMRASFGEAGRVLLGSDLLTKAGQTDVVSAMDDYEDEPTRVQWSPERESHGYYGSSGKWVSVPAEELTLYGVKMPAFLAQLLVRCERITAAGKEPLIADILWDLGTVKLEARSKPVSVWFARRLFDDGHRGKVQEIAAKRPPAETRVIITTSNGCEDLATAGHLTVSIRDVVEDTTVFVIDPAVVARRLKLVPSSILKPIPHSADYGTIHIGDETYKFRGVQHRAILEILVDAYNDNDPVRLTGDILEEIKPGPKVTNLARAFSGNKHWHKFIKEEAGQCWIEI
jgi:hypothetical protein